MSGTSQVQTMPIVNTTQDQPTHDNTNSAIMITSPDRNQSAECSLILPSTVNTPMVTDENAKLPSKKDDVPAIMEEAATTPQSEVTGTNLLFLLNINIINFYSLDKDN